MRQGRFNQKQGFTLIEIIIVVVILGILAAIALPKITGNIDRARAAEAFNAGSNAAKAFGRCLDEQSAGAAVTAAMVGNCDILTEIGMADPSTASTMFSYSYLISGTTTNTRMLATMRAAIGGVAGTDVIEFTYNGTTGATTRGCGGRFAPMCKN